MITEVYGDFRILHRQGKSIREICRLTGLSRNTVRNASESRDVAPASPNSVPEYVDVDVIVRRWQEYTGNEAMLEGSGESLEEIAALRAAEARD